MAKKLKSERLSKNPMLNRIDLEPSDSCGVGLIAAINGIQQHRILQLGLTALGNVSHRGAVAADGKTGDGCGVLTDIPRQLVRSWLDEINVEDPVESIGIGTVFLPVNGTERERALQLVVSTIGSQGLRVEGIRSVPVNEQVLGKQARKLKPDIVQLFVSSPEMEREAFERRLFIARRNIELNPQFGEHPGLHIASLSCEKIVYKAMVLSSEIANFYPDLKQDRFLVSACVYHQRFSTNTAPDWSLCQPFRMLAHNGEINTIRGNRNWMTARESSFDHENWVQDRNIVTRLFNFKDSDSASLDNSVELLRLSGRSTSHVLAMLIPPAWENDPRFNDEQRAFYRYHSCFCEPWDGPAAVIAFDGKTAVARLDRNGLRPLRYQITKDHLLIVGSEVGAERADTSQIQASGRLGPGQSLAVEFSSHEVLFNNDIENRLVKQRPYSKWLKENHIRFSPSNTTAVSFSADSTDFLRQQIAAGLTREELELGIKRMAKNGVEPTFSMGLDTPLAVLSEQPRHIGDYFKQRFAQVTNPPIDSIRERCGMSIEAGLGPERNLLQETPEHCRVLSLESPILLPSEFESLKQLSLSQIELDCTWAKAAGADGLKPALDRLVSAARMAVENQNVILHLSDRSVGDSRVAIPSLLAVGAVHHGLSKTGQRMMCSIVCEAADVRDSHHAALLFGYGCTAIYPYLSFGSIERQLANGELEIESLDAGWDNYRESLNQGLRKIMAKMGISVLNSYQGAQIFEAIGLGSEVMDKCFKYSYANLGGIDFATLAGACIKKHDAAFRSQADELKILETGISKPKRAGEHHVITGKVTKSIHRFARENEAEYYREFLNQLNSNKPVSVRDLTKLVPKSQPVALAEVEPIESIRTRFTTAAMSLGAISPEAHEALAIAMNAIGGKSNSGEGGEDPGRFKPALDGRSANSKIKQIASGRFGVDPEYLSSAAEIEIKMAQGAKPGEGGQLPGFKVNELIARLRNTSPGVTLISPPPHHDIYSIEDLSQLIYDLKLINPDARICVKLVAKSGVGGIAIGVAKAGADIILISGHEGGTGASPLTSIKHAGLPWELGVAETHQSLCAADLRNGVVLRADGGLRSGLDIIKAAIFGAEEYNFGTMALIALGCVYVKKCHLNNCPVGIATQDPKYRSKFKGTPENLVNYLNGVADECRQIMASLGCRNMQEVIGNIRLLEKSDYQSEAVKRLNLGAILFQSRDTKTFFKTTQQKYDEPISNLPCFDDPVIKHLNERDVSEQVKLEFEITNTDRNIGTKLSGFLTRHSGMNLLTDDSILLRLTGTAGQSLGAFLCGGISIRLTGDANDYVGKGMAGGKIVIKPYRETLISNENVIAGNAILYGATNGTLYASGQVAERFCVRNSGAVAVVEGCGDHSCEYMTRGTAVIIGNVGNNFAAGMTGGQAFVISRQRNFVELCNQQTVEIVALDEDSAAQLESILQDYVRETGSSIASERLNNWRQTMAMTKWIIPKSVAASLAKRNCSDKALR